MELISDLKSHINEKSYFYKIRSADRDIECFCKLTDVERASRIIYLNRTCYNGVYRVNKKGQFNVPFGRYVNPNIVNAPLIQAVSEYLNNNRVKICCGDFESALVDAKKGDFIYFDPPYDPISDTASFTAYNTAGFHHSDQERLAKLFADLDKKGCLIMLSNSSTVFIKELYSKFNIMTIPATRTVNSIPSKRNAVNEILVTNYGVNIKNVSQQPD